MKKILLILLITALILRVTGCASKVQTVGLGGTTRIVVDEETGVNYIFHTFSDIGCGMSPRYNADGTLYVSEVE